jgi:ribosomal protein L7/L12
MIEIVKTLRTALTTLVLTLSPVASVESLAQQPFKIESIKPGKIIKMDTTYTESNPGSVIEIKLPDFYRNSKIAICKSFESDMGKIDLKSAKTLVDNKFNISVPEKSDVYKGDWGYGYFVICYEGEDVSKGKITAANRLIINTVGANLKKDNKTEFEIQ